VKLSSIEEQTIHVRILQTADKEISQLNSRAMKFRELKSRMKNRMGTVKIWQKNCFIQVHCPTLSRKRKSAATNPALVEAVKNIRNVAWKRITIKTMINW